MRSRARGDRPRALFDGRVSSPKERAALRRGIPKGSLAIAHNGNLTNAKIIRDELQNYGSIFQSTIDTEVIVHLIALSHENLTVDRLISGLRRVEGSYSLLVLTDKEMIAVRDPHGFRPLVLGRLRDAYAVSSETCSFDLIEADYPREVEPGEVVRFSKDGIRSYFPFKKAEPRRCIFEYIYFARPDSQDIRPDSLRREEGLREGAGPGKGCRCGRGDPYTRLRHKRGDRLFSGVGHPL